MRSFALSSLRIRFLILVAISVFPALGLLFYNASVQRNETEKEIHDNTAAMAGSIANNLEQLVAGSHQVLLTLSKLPYVQNLDSDACNSFFYTLNNGFPMYRNIAAFKLNGDNFCSGIPFKGKLNISNDLYFQKLIHKKTISFDTYRIGEISNKPLLNIAYPILTVKKQIQGAVVISLDVAWLREELDKILLPEKASLMVIDREGTILYLSPDSQKWIGKNIFSERIVKTILNQKTGMVEGFDPEGIKRIFSFLPVQGTNNGMYVCLGIAPDIAFAGINKILKKNLLTLFFVSCMVGAFAWFGGDYFIMRRRIRRLAKATDELSKGNLNVRVNVSDQQDEIAQLGERFNRMTEALQRHITDLKQAEESLKISEEKYRTLFEESKDGVFMSTPEGRYLDMNPAGLEMLGYASKEELLAIDITTDIYANPDDRISYQKLLERAGYVKDYEIQMKKRDGTKITVLSTTTTVRDKNNEIILYRGIMRDITEHKRLELQLLQAQKMEAVGQLAGGIAHDFNNILTAIMGYGHILQIKMPANNPDRIYVDQMLGAANRAAEVTRSLLAFSRQQLINPPPINVHDIIIQFEKLFSRIIGEHIEVVTSFQRNDIIITADASQIEQVLMNLATNARDAMPNGGKLALNIELANLDDSFVRNQGYGKAGTYALISVSDTGIGMEQEVIKKIYDPFFTTKEVGKGTGLGLAMVFGIMKQHEGYILVDSKPGSGTIFKLYLPAVIQKKAIVVKPPDVSFPKQGTETILVAEDDEFVRNLAEIVLSHAGYTVISARDGEEAIQKFKENKDNIRLILMDVIMPGKKGTEAYEEIKHINPDVKIIFSSGYTANMIHKDSLLQEHVNFVPKPLSPKYLLQKVRDVLDA
ncbi:MAG: cache domain-containing protein [Nitrospirota bacterium]